jgi:hypothetical protein
MRIRVVLLATVMAVSACGTGTSPSPVRSDEPQTQYGESIKRANDVADQVGQREADLEQMVNDLDG